MSASAAGVQGGGGIAAVEVINRHLRELLVGRSINSVEDIARLWDDQYKASLPYGRSGIAVMAISGVDLALWDALGRGEKKVRLRLVGWSAAGRGAGLRHRLRLHLVSRLGL